MKKCILFFLTLMLLCNILSGCAVYHKLTTEERRELSTEIKEYFSAFPDLLGDYIAEESWTELNVCNPQNHFDELYHGEFYKPDECYYSMFENCSLKLKNGERLIIRYALAKGSKIVDHAFIYKSPEFPCNTLEDALEEMNNHRPNFSEIEWLEEVGKDFYPPDTDISAEWDLIYDEMLQEIKANGLKLHKGTATYMYHRFNKMIYATESGEYYFRSNVTYNEALAYWGYQYTVELKPTVP